MNLLEEMKKNNTITNTKGSEYFESTYNDNLDVFTMLSRYNRTEDIIKTFNKALIENEDLALANLLYILDIRNGKGERRLFKTIYKDLCINNPNKALKILPFIETLGRFDYVLEGINTKIEKETIELIKKRLELDLKSDNPSLLAKWLPSHRTHNKNNVLAKKIASLLGMPEKEYRKMLSTLRTKINIVEKNLTNKEYNNIDFSKVPTKAMLKYNTAFNIRIKERFEEYKQAVKQGKTKINTKGLYCYEIIKKIMFNRNEDENLYDLMWENQKNILNDNSKNILVVADTSGSMYSYNNLPISTSVGLAIYMAERNKGIFHNKYITFSERPVIQEIKGNTITEKIRNMSQINPYNTDIDKVFYLILKTASNNNLKQQDLPSHIIIVSDMEFDMGVQGGTNYSNWKKSFEEKGYKLPSIIFWNVAAYTGGVPVTKYDNDVALISGFSTNIIENILTIEKYNPIDVMLEKLHVYLEMLKS